MTAQQERKHPRYSVELAAEVAVGSQVFVATTDNLSLGGVALVLDRSLDEGSSITVELFLTQDGIEDPDEAPFEASATVVWAVVRDDGCHVAGVRFDRVDESQQRHLERFLSALGG